MYGMDTILMFEIGIGAVLFIGTLGLVLFHVIRNRMSPKLTVDAAIVSKRKIRARKSSSSTCFVTFEFEGGETKEFWVTEINYRKLQEDDVGKLTYQGTRYIGFEKDRFRSSQKKGLRVLDVFSWLPESEVSTRVLEHIFLEYMNGAYISDYQVSLSMPSDVDDRVLDAQFCLEEEGRLAAYILKENNVVAVIGYKE